MIIVYYILMPIFFSNIESVGLLASLVMLSFTGFIIGLIYGKIRNRKEQQ